VQVGRKNVCVFINGAVLDNGFGSAVDVQQLVEPVVEEVYLQVKAPAGHVLVKIEQVGVLVNVFKLRNPFVMLAEHFSERCFSRPDVSRDSDVFWFLLFSHDKKSKLKSQKSKLGFAHRSLVEGELRSPKPLAKVNFAHRSLWRR
jgi:hypothetical protein